MQQMGMMQQQLQATQNYSAPAPVVQQPVVQQQPEQSFSYDDFVNDPAKVIQAQIQRSLNPLQQSLQSMTRTTHYQNVIRPQVAAHPNVAPHWDRIAGIVDNYIQSQVLPNRDVTQQDLEFAVTNAIGRMAMQGNFGQQQQQQQTTQQTTQQVPPTTRPSVAPLPSTQQNNAPKLRPLTELENRLRSERRMSHAQWLYDAGEISVDTAKQADPNFKP
jgi:hypothetical protein